ncbi:MAG: Hdr-like menaquinol oxidoreductase cytochrome c subunit [Pseudomonadota bacterium]
MAGPRTALLAAALALTLAAAWAAAPERTAPAGRVPVPALPEARGGACVEPAALMRRNHAALLTHQRDRTVRAGVRGERHSLQGCVDCHAGAASGSVAAGPGDFCQSCHRYAAVRIDCFECHASQPRGRAAGVPR